MITGTVTADREAVVPVEIEGPTGQRATVDAAIDTGFNGFLVLPPTLVERLSLPVVGGEPVTLADGSETTLAIAGAPPEEQSAALEPHAENLLRAWREALAEESGDRRSALRRAARALGLKRSELHRRLAELGEGPERS